MSMSDKVEVAKLRKAQKVKKTSPALSVGDVKTQFAEATTLKDAVELIRDAGVMHKSYAHYTTLDVLVKMIKRKQWWLTRADSLTFDDLIEANKYGSKSDQRKLYFACFSYQQAENAAMWGLYTRSNRRGAVRISLPASVVRRWLTDLQSEKSGLCIHPVRQKKAMSSVVACAEARACDVLYASVRRNRMECERANSIRWNDVFRGVDDLEEMRSRQEVTGLLKDYEWRFEYESRLMVRTAVGCGRQSSRIAIDIPDYVFRAMTFTRSPWVRGRCDYPDSRVMRLLEGVTRKGASERKSLFRKSVLTKGLKKWISSRKRSKVG